MLLRWVISMTCWLWSKLPWTWWSKFGVIWYIWSTSWPRYLSMMSTISWDLTFIWLLTTMSWSTFWISHLMWMVTYWCYPIKWTTRWLLCTSHLSTSWSWSLSNSSATLSSIEYFNRTISKWAQYRLGIILLCAIWRSIFWTGYLSICSKIWWWITISNDHAMVVWKHMAMWNLSLILRAVNHLLWCT